jgi:hypothetical protein
MCCCCCRCCSSSWKRFKNIPLLVLALHEIILLPAMPLSEVPPVRLGVSEFILGLRAETGQYPLEE